MASSSKNDKESYLRGWEIAALVAACIGLGAFGYGQFDTIPTYRKATAEEKEASQKYFEATEKRKKELKGKKGPDGPEVKQAGELLGEASERKSSAMINVILTAMVSLALGLWGFLAGLVAVLKIKYRWGKIFKRVSKRVFAILALLAGGASLYLGGYEKTKFFVCEIFTVLRIFCGRVTSSQDADGRMFFLNSPGVDLQHLFYLKSYLNDSISFS